MATYKNAYGRPTGIYFGDALPTDEVKYNHKSMVLKLGSYEHNELHQMTDVVAKKIAADWKAFREANYYDDHVCRWFPTVIEKDDSL